MPVRPTRPALAGLIFMLGAGVGAVPAAIAAEPVEDALRGWVATIDASPSWAARFEAIDVSAGAAVMRGLKITAEDSPLPFEADFGALSVAGYAVGPGAGFSADAITIDAIRMLIGPSVMNVSAIRLDRLAIPDFTAVYFDPDRPFTSMMKFYQVALQARLAEGTIGEVAMVQTVGPDTSRVTYQNFKFTGLENGRIASATAGPFAMTAPSPEGLVRMSVDRVESFDTDLSAFVHVFDPDAYAGGVGDMTWRQAMRMAAYRNMVLEVPGARVVMKDLEMEGFRFRQPARPFTPFLDLAMANPNMTRSEMDALGQDSVLDMVSAFGIGRLSLRGVEVVTADIDRFHLGDFSLIDFSIDGLGEASVSDLDVVVGGEGSVRLQRFAIGEIEFPPIEVIRQAILAESGGGPEPAPTDVVPRLGFVEAMGVVVGMPASAPVTLDRARLTMQGYLGAVPTLVDFEMLGLSVPVALADRGPRETLSALGYTDIKVDAGYRLRWNEVDKSVEIRDVVLSLADIGTVKADVTLSGLTRQMIEHPETIETSLGGLMFDGARITVVDNSITNRVLGMQAAQMNVEPEKFRQQMVAAVPFFITALQNAGFQAKIAPALQAFLSAPGELTIEAKPLQPVPFSIVLSTAEDAPQNLPDLLSIEITNR